MRGAIQTIGIASQAMDQFNRQGVDDRLNRHRERAAERQLADDEMDRAIFALAMQDMINREQAKAGGLASPAVVPPSLGSGIRPMPDMPGRKKDPKKMPGKGDGPKLMPAAVPEGPRFRGVYDDTLFNPESGLPQIWRDAMRDAGYDPDSGGPLERLPEQRMKEMGGASGMKAPPPRWMAHQQLMQYAQGGIVGSPQQGGMTNGVMMYNDGGRVQDDLLKKDSYWTVLKERIFGQKKEKSDEEKRKEEESKLIGGGNPANRGALQAMNRGGFVQGPAGVDKVPAVVNGASPAALTAGEFVIKKPVVDQHGPAALNALNQGRAAIVMKR